MWKNYLKATGKIKLEYIKRKKKTSLNIGNIDGTLFGF